jgi:PAS domain S-box-containing protein
MKDFFRQTFQPLIEIERRTWAAKFLAIVLVSSIVVNISYVLVRLVNGVFFTSSNVVNFALLVIQLVLLIPVRMGHLRQAIILLVLSTWVGMTYNAWIGMGVHDSAVVVYLLIILAGALVMGWRFVVAVTVLSILSVWGLAMGEAKGVWVSRVESPISTAWGLSIIFLFAVLLVYMIMSAVRRSNQAVKESEQRFGSVFRMSPVAISVIALHSGKLLDANAAYWKLTGLDSKTSLGRSVADLNLGFDEASHRTFVEVMLKERSFHFPTFDLVNADGEKRVTTVFHELIDSSGEPTVLSMFYDITDQVIARDALQRSETRMRALLEATPDMIFEFDREGRILQFIPSSTMSAFLPPEQFLSRLVSEIMPPDVAEQTMFAIKRTLETGLLQAFEYQLLQMDDQRYFEASLIRNDAETVIAMVRDITVKKWAATERDKLIDELEAKNAELEQFTYTVSHDLKSPLITITGFLGYVMEDIKSGDVERLNVDVQRIGDAAEKMQKLLNDLLELSRVGRLINDPEVVDMNKLVAEAVEFLHGRISQGNIQVRVAPNLPSLYVDRQRIFEVLLNLVDNASKFMGSQLTPCIEIGCNAPLDGMSVFFVRDNGMGISPEFKDKIFGLFNKLDARTDGTGIGLALVKRIIEYHGGRIWVESKLGEGATFFFTLPAPPTLER